MLNDALVLMGLMVMIGLILPPLFTFALANAASVHGSGHTPASSAIPVAQDPFFPAGEDLAEALAQATREGRSGVAVLFEMNDCGQCARLRAGPLSDPRVRDVYRRHFVTLGLHADTPQPLRAFDRAETTSADFALGQRVVALPTVVLYDLNGLPVARRSGGKTDADTLIRLARYVTEKGYESAPFAARQPKS
ncbi:MAG: thioredoxin fold domain-containing protein [Chromatiales bacterium]|nr:thioredoxin fold domain-containing protein [Chromatiales bacterium]